ncbi:hypothetical protein PACILC2_45290 [Paenibacillus cisolokensis]|uniref:Response regulatory domain-containing protein n=1 Tax=Paenibacillus cisolokensis TaxID=1658519 RepID=A0ABQ4NCL7_9BACL|nr:hypothetical protein PACILC2_45290 [Paenibacillus cisolokensis]
MDYNGDEERRARETLRNHLIIKGCHVIEESDGISRLNQAVTSVLDLIELEPPYPEWTDGVFAAHLRKYKAPPILMLSIHTAN